jgi:hypothetical protein
MQTTYRVCSWMAGSGDLYFLCMHEKIRQKNFRKKKKIRQKKSYVVLDFVFQVAGVQLDLKDVFFSGIHFFCLVSKYSFLKIILRQLCHERREMQISWPLPIGT